MKPIPLSLALIACASLALAHAGATGFVKERMDGMESLADAMKSLAQMARSGEADARRITGIALAIQAQSGEAMTARFPEGSAPPISEAAPRIWQDWEGFNTISATLFDAAVQLEAQAGSPDLNLAQTLQDMGATCLACHQDYRVSK